MRLGADAGAEGTDGDRATGSRQTAQAPRCPAPRPGRPERGLRLRGGSASEPGTPLARTGVCFISGNSLVSSMVPRSASQTSPPRAGGHVCPAAFQRWKVVCPCESPSKLFICSIYKCVCTYTDLWASVWLISIFCKYGRPSRSQRARQGPCRPAARPTSVFTSLINGSLSLYRKAGFSFLFSFLQK